MGINNINSTYHFSFASAYIDSEHKAIMSKLLSYGATPSGDKSTDRAKLRRIEQEKAKEETTPSTNKFLTVSASEMEKMIEKKKGADILSNYNKISIIKRK